jgi:hypothetical protein
MHDDRPLAAGSLTGLIALHVVLSAALVAFLWETLNQLLEGHPDGRRILLSLPALLLFGLLLYRLARAVQRLDTLPPAAGRESGAGTP